MEEGQVVAGEARLICDYDQTSMFEEYKEMINDPEGYHSKNHTDSDDEEEKHVGTSIVATDQSAITGESLAVDKYMGDVCYYTTGCKRGHAYSVVTESARGSVSTQKFQVTLLLTLAVRRKDCLSRTGCY